MRNCWPKPVESLPSAPKPASPAETYNHHKPVKRRANINNINVVEHYNSASPKADRHDHQHVPVENHQQVLDQVPPTPPAGACGKIITPNLKMFTYAELRSATRNFGRVFKCWVDEKTYSPSRVGVGIPVAVKKSNPDSEQGLSEWQAEVTFLGKFSHPNLVKLLGYCWEDKEFLLVYEYMQRGSLESHLFRKTLSWETRLQIAIGAAQGLAFLHNTEKQVIYRDFKASNILLDSLMYWIRHTESISCLEQLDIGRLNMSARYYKEIAELYEQEQNLEQTIVYYERAADLFQSECHTSANQCRQKIALEQYPKAIEIYEDIARQSLNNNLLKYGVKGHLLNAAYASYVRVMLWQSIMHWSDIRNSIQPSQEHGNTDCWLIWLLQLMRKMSRSLLMLSRNMIA